MNSLKDVWDSVLKRLGGELSDVTIRTWFDEVDVVTLEDSAFVLHCSNTFKKSTIEARFLPHIKAALLSPFITVPFVNGKITVGPWQNLTLIECDTRDRVRDIVFQVMGEQAARRLQKRSQHDQRNAPRNGGVFFAYCCRKAQKIDCNLCRVVVSFFYCPLKGCHRKALNRERGEPWKSGTACPRPSAW